MAWAETKRVPRPAASAGRARSASPGVAVPVGRRLLCMLLVHGRLPFMVWSTPPHLVYLPFNTLGVPFHPHSP